MNGQNNRREMSMPMPTLLDTTSCSVPGSTLHRPPMDGGSLHMS